MLKLDRVHCSKPCTGTRKQCGVSTNALLSAKHPKSACNKNEYTHTSWVSACCGDMAHTHFALGCKVQLSRKSAVKTIPQPFHWATLEYNCVHWPKKAGLLFSSHQPHTILCLSCSSWLLASSIVDPALVLPYCDNSHPQLWANKYLFGFVAMFAPLQAHGPCFSLPRICGSLQGSPALLSCRNKHVPGE